MKTYGANDVRTHFAEIMDLVIKEPVMITKNGREKAVIMNKGTYQRLLEIEDARKTPA